VTSLSLIANVYRDCQTGLGLNPYLGIGLGVSHVKFGGGETTIGGTIGGASNMRSYGDTILAYAAMAGVSVPVAESTSLSVEYTSISAPGTQTLTTLISDTTVMPSGPS